MALPGPRFRPPALVPVFLLLCLAVAGSARAAAPIEETYAGYAYYRELAADPGFSADTAAQRHLATLGTRVVANSDRPDEMFTFTILKQSTVAAFSTAGNYVYVTEGLLRLINDEMLMAVLGHEMAHVILRHNAATVTRDLVLPGLVTDTSAARIIRTAFSREEELEADRYGALYAFRAGASLAGALDLNEAMTAALGELTPEQEAVSSHPRWSLRRDELLAFFGILQATVAEFNTGVQHLRARRYAAARAVFSGFVRTFPRSANGWANLGAAVMGELLAGTTAPGGYQLDPGWYESADVVVRGAGDDQPEPALDPVLTALAERAGDRVLELRPGDPVALANRAVLRYYQGRFVDARELAAAATASETAPAAAWLALGCAAVELRDTATATRAFDRAIAVQPADPLPLYNRARYRERTGQSVLARADWETLARAAAYRLDAADRLGEDAVLAIAAALAPLPAGYRGVAVGDTRAALETRLGPPTDRFPPADGVAVWSYADSEVSAGLDAAERITFIEVGARGAPPALGVGLTRAEFVARYGYPQALRVIGNQATLDYGPFLAVLDPAATVIGICFY